MAFVPWVIVLGRWRFISSYQICTDPCGNFVLFTSCMFWYAFLFQKKEAEFFAQNEGMYGDKEHLSQVTTNLIFCNTSFKAKMIYMIYNFYFLQQEYIRGISAWNFNLDDLKRQAALVSRSFIVNKLSMLFFFLHLWELFVGKDLTMVILMWIPFFMFRFKMMMTSQLQKFKSGTANKRVDLISQLIF